MQKIRIKNIKSGFSLLETIVAISILMITIVGPLTLASKGIVFANYVRDEITGFYLAQEGLEAIRNIRDTNLKGASSNVDWLAGIKDENIDCVGDNVCRLDIWEYTGSNKGLTSCRGQCTNPIDRENFERMKVVDLGGSKLYGYFDSNNFNVNPDDSIFSRKIVITDKTPKPDDKMSSADRELLSTIIFYEPTRITEINVSVTVSWLRPGLGSRGTVTVSENMSSSI